ncbi:hypothetical protein HBI56_145580 [Parastagonospora nodorum]|nr:hypothetical protein HBH53_042080 [Parastagonospora nodorum]KAH3979883.1 hypothetical protein HBH51_053110 [Parastagonospora nodorum]KAH4341287.1 hypothetical protein HBH98_176360 [Parastagonospora nodorum]KAH4369344.1 hypothetical protein HBH97_147500 [Parastagonospora nodorum]KAH4386941.1 hypothetical protein HBH99_168330 [Parastagonospora nodorum]
MGGKHRGQVLGSVGRVYGHWALGRHRGYLTVLNDRSAKAVNEDGRAISPESSDLSTTIKIDWPTSNGLRPGITFQSPKEVKMDDGDTKADWPAAGRALA